MEFVQSVIKTTTGNTVVRQPISWAWPGNRCMYQVTFLNLVTSHHTVDRLVMTYLLPISTSALFKVCEIEINEVSELLLLLVGSVVTSLVG